jgi:mono/diheme cytochrome c family protein
MMIHALKRSKILLPLLILMACSDMGDPLILLPDLTLSHTALDFGAVTLQETQSRELQIMNRGEGELSGIISLTQTGNAFSSSLEGSFEIAGDDTLLVSIGFTPSASESYSAELILTTNDPGNEDLLIDLSGEGTTLPVPAVTVSQTSLDFGSLMVGESNELPLSIQNIGTADLVIEAITFDLSDLSHDASFPMTLSPGSTQTINFEYAPTAVGNHSGSLMIISNAASSPDAVVLAAQVVAPISYAADVQPIWSNSCSGCHGTSGGLTLTSYNSLMAGNSNNGPVVIPGDGANSLIVRKLKGTAGALMPAGGPALSPSLINSIETWIDQGAQNN